MDAAIDALFQPCRHAIACLTCAEQCERCPFCRANISEAQRIYFQGEVSAAAAQRAAAQPWRRLVIDELTSKWQDLSSYW